MSCILSNMYTAMILIAGDRPKITNGNLSPSLSSATNASFVRPSSQQIWERIYGQMLALHPDLAAIPPLTYPEQGRTAVHFQPLTDKAVPSSNIAEERSCIEEQRRPSVENRKSQVELPFMPHNPSCSLLSVRLPPIDEGMISPSGREALKKLRGELKFKK